MAANSFAFAFAFASAQPITGPIDAVGPAAEADLTEAAQQAQSATNLPATEAAPADASAVAATERLPPPPAQTSAGSDDAFLDEIKEPSDPVQFFNRPSFAVSMALDKVIIRPAAMVYRTVLPEQARDGIRNGLRNFNSPLVFANDVLQLQPKRAIRTLGRFLVNSLLGIGGLFDVAKKKPFNLPHHSNSFGNTLGYYGLGPGPYLYIPVLGPTTLRDGAAQFADSYASPRLLGSLIHPDKHGPFLRNKLELGKYGTAMSIVDGLDQREQNDSELKALLNDSVDPYASFRSSFLQNRAGEIAELRANDGQAMGSSSLNDPLTDPAAGK
jgi:phospholipid-binding lipoprotein MlaA